MANDAIQFQHWLMNAIESSIRDNLDYAVTMLQSHKPHIIVSVLYSKFGTYFADRGEYILDMARRNKAITRQLVLDLLDGDILTTVHMSEPIKVANDLRYQSVYARRLRQFLRV